MSLTIDQLTMDQFLSIYPYLLKEDVIDAIHYCSTLKCIDQKPEHFCDGCTLDFRREENPSIFIDNLDELKKYLDSHPKDESVFLGTAHQYEEEQSVDCWHVATLLGKFINS